MTTTTKQIQDPTAPRTERQTELLTHLARQFYTGPQVDQVLEMTKTKGEASDAIDKMLAAGGTKPAKAQPRKTSSSGGSKATPKQVSFAAKLIAQGRWHDSFAGQFSAAPTRSELERMSKREISELIDDLKNS